MIHVINFNNTKYYGITKDNKCLAAELTYTGNIFITILKIEVDWLPREITDMLELFYVNKDYYYVPMLPNGRLL